MDDRRRPAGSTGGRAARRRVTALPRWTRDPVPGVGDHERDGPRRRRGAACAGWPTSWACRSTRCVLAAHAKVLAALSGEAEVVTGYVDRRADAALPADTAPATWRELLHETARAESALLAAPRLPGRRAAARAGPGRPVVRDRARRRPATADGLGRATPCCGSAAWPPRRPTGAAAALPDRRARRRRRGPDRRLPPHRARADRRRPGRRARPAEPAVGRGAALPARRAGRAAPRAAGPPGRTSCSSSGCGAPGRRRGRARRPAVDLPRAQRPRQPAGPGAAGARAAAARASSRW